MADCPYARCIQERRHIRRELLRWTKNMVFVVGLERVAEELMGRRKWKQYQDTLYSSTRSELATQPAQHRHYPTTIPTNCNLAAGNITQVGGGHHQPTSGQSLNQPTSAVTPPPISTATINPLVLKQQLNNHKLEEQSSCRVKSEDIKIELDTIGTEENGTRSGETLQHGEVLLSVKQQLTTRQRIEDETNKEENENGELNDDEEIPEKRLKLDENTSGVNSLDTLLRENDKSTKDDVIDSEGSKERTSETLERVQVTPGLLRVKKEEELQELPQQVNCGGERTVTDIKGTSIGGKEQLIKTEFPTALSYTINRRISPPPEDWKPLDKCYLCLDGKLPHDNQPPLSPQSESSSSSRSAESPMSVQIDPMVSVVAAFRGTYPTLLPQWCLPPRETPLVGVQTHQETGQIADQPLDLSAKPKSSQNNNVAMLEQQKIPLRMPAGVDPKTIFASSSYRAKPRLTGPVGVGGVPVVGGGRRTYTEEELQAALRDIQSGKLGTRRAAVIYGIPRSTLRNKVYKLAMERERDASLSSTHSHTHDSGLQASTIINTTTTTTLSTSTTPNTTKNATATTPPSQVDEADDKELSGAEEEKEVEKALLKPLLSLEDLVRFSALEGSGGDSLRTLLQRGQETGTEWPGFEHANIGPYIQKMLAAAAPFKGLDNQEYRIPEVMKRLISEDKRLNNNVNGDHHPHLQHQSLQSQQSSQTPQESSHQSQLQRVPMSTDEYNFGDEDGDSAQGRAILKIPSYKPASTPGSSKNNGEPTSAAFAQSFAAGSSTAGSPGLLERASPAFSGTSSPTNSLVGKAVNFRDVIAKSISSKFQESQPGQHPATMPGQTSMLTDNNPFKRGRYTPPQTGQNQQHQQQSKQQSQSQSQDKSKAGSGSGGGGGGGGGSGGSGSGGGKGTRPKRGKYRNYDRDSLVEAVRAVQRGEMSVHRAGSYYGVPHSTLEYKVKERHLMRPRKRDQKQPDDKAKESTAAITPIRPGLQDKKPPIKPQKSFTPGPGNIPGPNGLKMPPFLEGMPHLPFPHPFNFWGPTPFMPSPFIPGAPNVPTTMLPEQYFATQRMRGLQELERNAAAQLQQQAQQRTESASASSSGTEPGTSNPRNSSSIVKTTRDITEILYDGSPLLDNLIRSSLETGIGRDQRVQSSSSSSTTTATTTTTPTSDGRNQQQSESISSKSLLDLCRNSRRTSSSISKSAQDSSEDESYRGSSIPDRPERVPTVDLCPSPTADRGRTDDNSNDRLTSPPTPLSRTGSRDDDTRDSRIDRLDRGSREREVHNGGQDDRDSSSSTRKTTLNLQQQLNHYPDIHNLYTTTTDTKKSACDSKLIVDQKNPQQSKEFAAVSGLVVQLQRGFNTTTNNRSTANEQNQQNNSQSSPAQSVQEPRGAVLKMEDSIEQ